MKHKGVRRFVVLVIIVAALNILQLAIRSIFVNYSLTILDITSIAVCAISGACLVIALIVTAKQERRKKKMDEEE